MIFRLSQCILIQPHFLLELKVKEIVEELLHSDPPIKLMTEQSWDSDAFKAGIVHPKGAKLVPGKLNPSYCRNGNWALQARTGDYVAILIVEDYKQASRAISILNKKGNFATGLGWLGHASTVANLMATDGVVIDGEVMNDPYLIEKLMENEEEYFSRIASTLRRSRIPEDSNIKQWAAWSAEKEVAKLKTKESTGVSGFSSLADMFLMSGAGKTMARNTSVSSKEKNKLVEAQNALIKKQMTE